MRLLLAFLFALGCLSAPTAVEAEPEDGLSARLAKLVDGATAEARRTQADLLSKDTSITTEAWRGTMARFGVFRRTPGGIHHETEAMHTGAGIEAVVVSLYVPKAYDPKTPSPLLLALHGSGGDGRGLPASWQRVADAASLIVVAPTDQRGIGGWTKTAPERQAAWAALRWARRTFNIDERRIHCTGISRGGHLTWDLALRQPDRFASIAPMIGGPLVGLAGGRNNLRMIENLVAMPIRDLQGSRDDAILVKNLRLAFERLKHFKAEDARLIEFPELGHSFEIGAVKWETFFAKARRPAVPTRVIRRTVHITGERRGEGRAAWVEVLATKKPAKEMFPLRVDPRQWNKMTDRAKRAFQAVEAEKHTARLEASMPEPGVFLVRTIGVKKFRLLLTPAMVGSGSSVTITVNGRKRTRKLKPSSRVLLREFAERFNRTFLPIYEVTLSG